MKSTELVEIKRNNIGTGLLIEHDGHISINDGHNKQLVESFRNNQEWSVPYPFIVDAVFQKCDLLNANGRIYPERVLRKQVEAYQQKIKEKRAYGECNHPSDSTIDLGRIAMNIVELHWESKTVVGKMEIITSEGFRKSGIISCLGDTCANLILNGLKIGVSSRGIGSVENKLGKLMVGDDFELICWDIVSDPSTPLAWISTSSEEIKTYIEHNDKDKSKVLAEKIEQVKELLK